MSVFSDFLEKSGLTVKEVIALTNTPQSTVYRWKRGESEPHPCVEQVLRDELSRRAQGAVRPLFRFVDLFAGIGGLRIGFDAIGGRCVFTSEWDRFAQATYKANFPDPDAHHVFAGDIREFTKDAQALDRIPAHDVLLAGFPCQPFSIAGVSKKNALGRPHGFLCDTQGTLFFDVAQIIGHHQPKAFLLENVKNLENHDGRRTFRTIMNVLENELGYSVSTRVISSEPWVPQRRQRIMMVGFRERVPFHFSDMKIPAGPGPVLGDILEEDVPEKYVLTEHLWRYLQNYRDKHSARGNGFGCSVFGPGDVTRTLSARYFKDGSEVLVDRGPGQRPRRLTPRECARLMGFERDGREWRIPVSDTQAYRQFGNAVVVPVVAAVAKAMEPHIRRLIGSGAVGDAGAEPARLAS
jgi:DNA (cytosine-5)-methyltransferase 1